MLLLRACTTQHRPHCLSKKPCAASRARASVPPSTPPPRIAVGPQRTMHISSQVPKLTPERASLPSCSVKKGPIFRCCCRLVATVERAPPCFRVLRRAAVAVRRWAASRRQVRICGLDRWGALRQPRGQGAWLPGILPAARRSHMAAAASLVSSSRPEPHPMIRFLRFGCVLSGADCAMQSALWSVRAGSLPRAVHGQCGHRSVIEAIGSAVPGVGHRAMSGAGKPSGRRST